MKTIPLKRICRFIAGGTPDTNRDGYWSDDGIPWVSISDMSSRREIISTRKGVSAQGLTAARLQTAPAGTVLFAMYASVGEVAFTTTESTWNQALLAITPVGRTLENRFLYYSLLNLGQDLPLYYRSNTQNNLNAEQVGNLQISLPSYSQQQQIADYLDHETADIDAAVSDQKQFIELLEERKQALTWRSVSGTDQIGNRIETGDAFWRSIPEDWALQKLGWNFKIGNGSTPSTSTSRFWSDSGFPWVNSSVVNQPLVTEPVRHVSEAALQELHLPIVPSGSLLIGITGQGKTRGTVTKLGITTTINQHIAYLAPLNEQRVTTDYTRAALEASYPQLRHISDGNGGTKGALTCEMLQQFKIPIPPRDVQDQVVKMLTSQSARISSALDDASAVIDLARERRAALITAAVTGQIDVTARNKPAAERLEDDIAQGLHREYA